MLSKNSKKKKNIILKILGICFSLIGILVLLVLAMLIGNYFFFRQEVTVVNLSEDIIQAVELKTKFKERLFKSKIMPKKVRHFHMPENGDESSFPIQTKIYMKDSSFIINLNNYDTLKVKGFNLLERVKYSQK